MRYRIVWTHDYNGTRGVLFPGPLTHEEACTCLFKITKHPWRTVKIERIAESSEYPGKSNVEEKQG